MTDRQLYLTCSNYNSNICTRFDTYNPVCKTCPVRGDKIINKLQQQVKELQEWKDANKPTGICETCTAKSLQEADIYRNALSNIDQIIKCSEQIACLNYGEIKKIREVLNTVNTKLHEIKVHNNG